MRCPITVQVGSKRGPRDEARHVVVDGSRQICDSVATCHLLRLVAGQRPNRRAVRESRDAIGGAKLNRTAASCRVDSIRRAKAKRRRRRRRRLAEAQIELLIISFSPSLPRRRIEGADTQPISPSPPTRRFVFLPSSISGSLPIFFSFFYHSLVLVQPPPFPRPRCHRSHRSPFLSRWKSVYNASPVLDSPLIVLEFECTV